MIKLGVKIAKKTNSNNDSGLMIGYDVCNVDNVHHYHQTQLHNYYFFFVCLFVAIKLHSHTHKNLSMHACVDNSEFH